MIIKLKNVEEKVIKKLGPKVFIYPTDTIYGLGCDATNKKLVNKIREIKGRDNKPFSVIAPNINWILKNCETNKKYLGKYLPGKYTLILRKKDTGFLKHVSQTEYLGIRIPHHDFTKMIQKMKNPVITTSVNFSGQKPANKIKEIDKKILDEVDLVIDGGTLSGQASIIIKEDVPLARI